MNAIFRYGWKGVKTGWDYRLDIILPSADALSNPTIYNLPPGSVEAKTLKFGYDKVPIGVGSVPVFDLTFHLSEFPNTETFTTLIKWIVEPRLFVTEPWSFNSDFHLSTFVQFYIKFNSNSATEVNIYRLIGTYCLRDNVTSLDIENQTCEVTAYDINKVIYDSIGPLVWGLFGEELYRKNSPAIAEFAFTDSGQNYGCFNAIHPNIMSFMSLNYVITALCSLGNTFNKKILRQDVEYLFTATLPRYYKQLYDGTGKQGAELTSESVYITETDDSYLFGSTQENDENSFQKRYKNSLWDFLTEFCETNLTKAIYSPSGIHGLIFVPAFGDYYNSGVIDLKIEQFNSLELHSFTNAIKKATASNYETNNVDSFSDIEKWDEEKAASRNEIELAIPLVFNNMPPAVKYTEGYPINPLSGENRKAHWATYPRTTGLFYFEKPAIFSEELAIRIHEYCEFYYTNAKSTSLLANCEFQAHDWLALGTGKPSENIMAAQATSNNGKWLARACMQLFGKPNQATLEGEIDFYELTWFETGGSIGFPWWKFDQKFNMDISSKFPYLELSNKFCMLSSELNFDTERAKIELYQVNQDI